MIVEALRTTGFFKGEKSRMLRLNGGETLNVRLNIGGKVSI